MTKVTIAGGGKLHTRSYISDCTHKIHGEIFCDTFRLLDLKKYEVILGGDYQHSLVTINLKTRELTIMKEGTQAIIFPNITQASESRMLGSKQTQKLICKGTM